jgi:hypothetical protein
MVGSSAQCVSRTFMDGPAPVRQARVPVHAGFQEMGNPEVRPNTRTDPIYASNPGWLG